MLVFGEGISSLLPKYSPHARNTYPLQMTYPLACSMLKFRNVQLKITLPLPLLSFNNPWDLELPFQYREIQQPSQPKKNCWQPPPQKATWLFHSFTHLSSDSQILPIHPDPTWSLKRTSFFTSSSSSSRSPSDRPWPFKTGPVKIEHLTPLLLAAKMMGVQ